MSEQESQPGVTGETVLEAQFDRKIGPHTRWTVSGWLVVSIVGIPLIPFWLLFSLWYVPEYLRRISARLTTQALEVRKGVFFRSEATIPLNRITDVRLHDGPLMRHYGLRGLKVETAGQSGDTGSEGNIIGVIDAVEFRNAVLRQRQEALGSEQGAGLPEYGRRSHRAPDGGSATSWRESKRWGGTSSGRRYAGPGRAGTHPGRLGTLYLYEAGLASAEQLTPPGCLRHC